MRFRHLDYAGSAPVEELGAAAIDDLLDRGDLDAWQPIASAVRRDPFGPLAETVLKLCAAHAMYGTSILWPAWIARLRRGPAPRKSIPLAALRTRAGVTQQQIAERMRISQSDVSKLERRADVKVSTLRAYLDALGATLRITAGLPKAKTAVDLSIGEVKQVR